MNELKFDQFISLGKDCHTAAMIRCKYFNDKSPAGELFYNNDLFMSTEYPFGSYLFDWLMMSSPHSIIKCIDLNFDGFVNFENFHIIKKRRGCAATNDLYELEFRHFDRVLAKIPYALKDTKKVTDYFESIFSSKMDKYKYLIDKMQKLLSSDKKILFIHDDYDTKTEINVFENLLNKLNTFNCDAHLMVMQADTMYDKLEIPKLYFGDVVRRGAWNPDHQDEYTSWLKSLKNFSFR